MNKAKEQGFMDKLAGKYENAARALAKIKMRNKLYRGYGSSLGALIGSAAGGPIGGLAGAGMGYGFTRAEQAASKLLAKSKKPTELLRARNLAGSVHAPIARGIINGIHTTAISGGNPVAGLAGMAMGTGLSSMINRGARGISDSMSKGVYRKSIQKAIAKDLARSRKIKAAKIGAGLGISGLAGYALSKRNKK